MASRAKIFRSGGGSRAVHLPNECRVRGRVILEPTDEWSRDFVNALGAWKRPIERRRSRAVAKMKHPFE